MVGVVSSGGCVVGVVSSGCCGVDMVSSGGCVVGVVSAGSSWSSLCWWLCGWSSVDSFNITIVW